MIYGPVISLWAGKVCTIDSRLFKAHLSTLDEFLSPSNRPRKQDNTQTHTHRHTHWQHEKSKGGGAGRFCSASVNIMRDHISSGATPLPVTHSHVLPEPSFTLHLNVSAIDFLPILRGKLSPSRTYGVNIQQVSERSGSLGGSEWSKTSHATKQSAHSEVNWAYLMCAVRSTAYLLQSWLSQAQWGEKFQCNKFKQPQSLFLSLSVSFWTEAWEGRTSTGRVFGERNSQVSKKSGKWKLCESTLFLDPET